MESILSNVLMFVLGLVALSFLVTIHELGHFLVAQWKGVKVNTFSIGFGKKLSKILSVNCCCRREAVPWLKQSLE